MTAPKPRLISAKLCPFVQRAVLMLEEKRTPYDVTYIDLKAKPDWFLALSPRGKVPVLVVGEVALFESQAICEYLEEAHPEPPLLPRDLVERARDRAWFPFAGDDLFAGFYALYNAKERDAVTAARERLAERITRLAQELGGRAYLSGNGSAFGIADVAVAPFFTRAAILKQARGLDLLAHEPKVAAWAERLLARPAVARSVPADFAELLREKLSGMPAA